MFIRLKKVFIFFIIPLILAVRIGTSFAELQGYERVNELPSRANELIRKLYGATMPFLSTVQNTVPTIYTLPSGWACIYQSGSTYRVYFNIANSIKYISFAITESGMLELLDDTTPQLGGDLDMNGFSVGGNTEAQLDAAVAANHAQQHSITSASDHTSSATPGQMLMADANGLPVDATNTDNEVSNAVNIVDANYTNWDTAYGWGDHANAGYLTTESDPVFSNSNVATVTSDQVDNWDTAYGWGNHTEAGYLTEESDPVYLASNAANVNATRISDWDTAYGWGNHANVGYLTVETDPIAGALTGIIVGNGTGVEATTDNHTNWDTVYALVNGNAATWTGKADYEFGANNFNGTGNFTTTGTISGVNATWSGKQDVLTDSASLASALGDETGSGLAVFNNSPTLVSPVLGVATGTRLTLSGMASVLSYVNASDQTVANNTTTTVVLDGESYDVGSDFASNTFTAPRSGYYWVGGKIDYSGGIVSGKAYAARIILNGGATPLNYIEVTAYNTSPLSLVIPMRKEYLSASDTLILEAYHIAGVDQLVKKGIGRTWLQVGEATN